MNLQSIIAALPWLRKLWRWLPGPLRVPLLVAAAVIWLYRRARGQETDGDGGVEGAAGATDDGAAGDRASG